MIDDRKTLRNNATSIMIIQGYVHFIGKQTMIKCPTAGIFHVTWKDGILPPEIKVGKYITILGKPLTLYLGKNIIMVSGEVLKPRHLSGIKKYLEACKKSLDIVPPIVRES